MKKTSTQKNFVPQQPFLLTVSSVLTMATHECSACLKETIKGATVVEPPLVLADSSCTAPCGSHRWTRIGKTFSN